MPDKPQDERSEALRRRCAWLCGIVAASLHTGKWPKWVNEADAKRVHAWAGQIAFERGCFNPRHLWEAERVIKETVAGLERAIEERQQAHG